MLKYRASLSINGERTDGDGMLSVADGKTVLSATFPKGEPIRSVVFTTEEEGCRMEKTGKLPLVCLFVPGKVTEMACETPYGGVEIPVLTERFRYRVTEEGATLWLSYLIPSDPAGNHGTVDPAAFCLENSTVCGEKFTVLFTLKKEGEFC